MGEKCARRTLVGDGLWASAQAGGAGGDLQVGGAETSAALLPRLGARSSSRRSTEALHALSTTAVEQVSVFVNNLLTAVMSARLSPPTSSSSESASRAPNELESEHSKIAMSKAIFASLMMFSAVCTTALQVGHRCAPAPISTAVSRSAAVLMASKYTDASGQEIKAALSAYMHYCQERRAPLTASLKASMGASFANTMVYRYPPVATHHLTRRSPTPLRRAATSLR